MPFSLYNHSTVQFQNNTIGPFYFKVAILIHNYSVPDIKILQFYW